jgi:hypothetical protein
VEAGLCKERIKQFQKLEEQKMHYELQVKHESERTQIEIEQSEELARLNFTYDEELLNLNNNFQEAQQKLKEKHEKEQVDKTTEFNRTFPDKPKPSTELLNLSKQLEGLGKQRE